MITAGSLGLLGQHLAALAGHGRVPLAVRRICTRTWACSPAPVGFNDHANARGYRAIAATVLNAVGDRSL